MCICQKGSERVANESSESPHRSFPRLHSAYNHIQSPNFFLGTPRFTSSRIEEALRTSHSECSPFYRSRTPSISKLDHLSLNCDISRFTASSRKQKLRFMGRIRDQRIQKAKEYKKLHFVKERENREHLLAYKQQRYDLHMRRAEVAVVAQSWIALAAWVGIAQLGERKLQAKLVGGNTGTEAQKSVDAGCFDCRQPLHRPPSQEAADRQSLQKSASYEDRNSISGKVLTSAKKDIEAEAASLCGARPAQEHAERPAAALGASCESHSGASDPAHSASLFGRT